MPISIGHILPENMKSPDVGPMTVQTIRERILMFSGLSSEQLGLMMGAGAQKLYTQLNATKTQYFAHDGKVVDQRTTSDHPIQQKAAVELIGLAERIGGLKAHESEGPGKGGNVTFDMSGWTLQPADSKIVKSQSPDDYIPIPVEPSE